jgi:formamidopyrimidine-DNA glycosylase
MGLMPELPEVQTIVSQLQRVLPGQAVASVSIRPGKIFRTGGRALKAALPGRRIEGVARHGKRIIIELSRRAAPVAPASRRCEHRRDACATSEHRRDACATSEDRRDACATSADEGVGRYVPAGSALVVHLGMTGGLFVVPADGPVRKHTHLRVRFVGRPFELRFVDPRRFGGVWLVDDASPLTDSAAAESVQGKRDSHTSGVRPPAGLRELGPDALALRVPVLRAILRRRRRIKALLLDQQAVSGLGNIYCDEALFAAGIHPLTRASDLNERQVRALAGAIRRTLRASIASGGTTVSDYRDAGGNMGGFQRRLRVYGREDEPCPRCGSSIRRILAAGRSTHLCPRCQPRRTRSGTAG